MVSPFLIQFFYAPYLTVPATNDLFHSYYWTNYAFFPNIQENNNRKQDLNQLSTQSDRQKQVSIPLIDQPTKSFKLNIRDQIVLPGRLVINHKQTDNNSLCPSAKRDSKIKDNSFNESKKRKSASKLVFQSQWKNQNRNIVPNIMNQMVSFLEKSHKSSKLVEKLFDRNSHQLDWTVKKFYFYMKIMKNKLGHYINENELGQILKIQDLKCQIYTFKEQMFYLKICRIALEYFLKNQVIFVSLTSKRMSQQKRKAHLIARRALTFRFRELIEIRQ